MFDSSMYGLSNPMMTEDIGYANLNRQLPMAPGYLSDMSVSYTGGAKLQGPLSNDTLVITQKEKDKGTWKTILTVGGLAVALTLGFKFDKKHIATAFEGIKNLFSKLKPKAN